MPTYVYRYVDDPEGETFEFFQSMKEDAFTQHPEDNRPIERVIQLPSVIMDSQKPKTLGSLAAKNTERMMKEGKIKPKPKEDNPWWRPNKKKPVDVKGKSQKQIERYVREGKL